MTSITKAQRETLTKASEAPDGVFEAPANSKLAKSLIKHGWAVPLPSEEGAGRLLITDAGRQAIAAAAEPATNTTEAVIPATSANAEPEVAEPIPAARSLARKSSTEWPTGKLGTLVALLQRPEGASLDDMVAATGWQAHSVRGAMSGSLKKGFGLVIDSRKDDGQRTYRILPEDAA
jgi:hypothetical protein